MAIRDKLEQYLVYPDVEPESGEHRAFCPLCEDRDTSKTPSCSINFATQVFYCQSCGEGGNLRGLIRAMRIAGAKTAPASRTNGKAHPAEKRTATRVKPLPSEEMIDHWHSQLMMRADMVKWLREKRGLTKATLRRFRLGYADNRITIPVRDVDGELVNVRRYKPNAKGADKMISWGPGSGTGRIFNPADLAKLDEVVLTEGEMDCIIARQHGLPAVTHTSGANHFKVQWAPLFQDKIVYIAYDEDDSGNRGANKVASILKNHAKAIYRIVLGTDIKSGDVTDYFVKTGGDHDSFIMLMQEAALMWERKEVGPVPLSGTPVSVEESQNIQYANQPLEMKVMVIGKQTPAFIAPKKMRVTCDQNAGNVCQFCPMSVAGGKAEIEVLANDDRLLNFVNASETAKSDLYRKMSGAKCTKNVDFDIEEGYNVEELIVSPSIDHRSEETETPINRRVYNVGTYKTPINNTVKIVGKQIPDPSTQRGTFMSWDLDVLAKDIDKFKMTPTIHEQLRKFQPKEGQTVTEKCLEIAQDMSANVTHIYGRDIMHIAMDLVYHSAISFEFDGSPIRKGWLEALILGDTRTGKSEAATALRHHYGAGVIRSCEGASFAGLVGGAQQVPGSKSGWIVTWGTIPLNDRRLVILDEMSGLMAHKDSHILGDMSSVRSEGKAAITKIVSEETSARTRLLWLSNPSSGERLSGTPGSALSALQTLVKNPEDIARFDYVMAVTNNEVPSSVINSTQHKEIPHVYDTESCHQLVTWCWARKSEDVEWSTGSEVAVFKAAEKLGAEYSPTPPLVQVENIRVKLARLAVAFAARTFSTDSTGEKVIVRRSHVQAAVRFLNKIYSSPAMSYVQMSQRILEDKQIAYDQKPVAKARLLASPTLASMILSLNGRPFRSRDLQDLGMTADEANTAVTELMGIRMLSMVPGGRIRAEAPLIELAHELQNERYISEN